MTPRLALRADVRVEAIWVWFPSDTCNADILQGLRLGTGVGVLTNAVRRFVNMLCMSGWHLSVLSAHSHLGSCSLGAVFELCSCATTTVSNVHMDAVPLTKILPLETVVH